MLNVENVSLHYGAAQALRDVSFKAEMGKITCVLGRNGVGKSSLLRAVTGQHPVTSGTISFNGVPLDGLAPFRRAKQGVGYV
ncbi:ATP-binding cassette domain-containing protein, partial [Sinorhizobium meliloti]